jgi:hypothetical protein
VELSSETQQTPRRVTDKTSATTSSSLAITIQEDSWSSPQSPLPTQPASPCSPWGHFVDLVVQDEINPDDDNIIVSNNNNSSSALIHHSSPWFLPTCPPPVLRSVEIRCGDTIPYPPIKLTKRRRLRENTTSTTSLAGLFLNVPDSNSISASAASSYTNSLLDKARRQFDNLKMSEI